MISFVWEPGLRLPAGTGGSENYTVGHVRELNRRGIQAQVVTIGLGFKDGRDEFTGIPFLAVDVIDSVSQLDGTVVFVAPFPDIATRRPAYQIMHVPPPLREPERGRIRAQSRNRTTSTLAPSRWSTRSRRLASVPSHGHRAIQASVGCCTPGD
jgi:D-inositol-3-phosphate glycosyltransferase